MYTKYISSAKTIAQTWGGVCLQGFAAEPTLSERQSLKLGQVKHSWTVLNAKALLRPLRRLSTLPVQICWTSCNCLICDGARLTLQISWVQMEPEIKSLELGAKKGERREEFGFQIGGNSGVKMPLGDSERNTWQQNTTDLLSLWSHTRAALRPACMELSFWALL